MQDSSATEHLTGSTKNFVFHFLCAGNEKIRIANGSLAHIARNGQFFPFEGLPLHNLLYGSKISYNLLSISKITCELNCKAAFLPNFVSFSTQEV